MKLITFKNLAVFIGRFQPFHIGHMSVVEKILTQYPQLLLVIGSADKSGTLDNPWTVQKREELIRASIPLELQERIDIAGLDDVLDDSKWCENLQNLITIFLNNKRSTINDQQGSCILFTGNEWVEEICLCHDIETSWITYDIDISGTQIRQMLKKGEDIGDYVLFGGNMIEEKENIDK